MNKNIKFRAWDKKHKKMVMVGAMELCICGDIPIQQVNEIEVVGYEDEDMKWYKIKDFDDFILMQYTGLRDKNGEEIYDGNIVKYKVCHKEMIGIIEYGNYFCKYGFSIRPIKANNKRWYKNPKHQLKTGLEIIGNIYENPKFLK